MPLSFSKKIPKVLVISLSSIILGIVFSYGLYLVNAWSEPGASPPSGNTATPLNVSGTGQTKTGNLTVPNLYLNATGAEGDILAIDELKGYNDLILRGNPSNNAPVYLQGNPVVINNDSGTGNVGIGNSSPGQKLSVAGIIETTSGGVKFPDGTIQTTAAAAGGGGAPNQQIYPTTLSCGFWCAANWCQTLNYDSKTDWRLPTLEELLSWTNSLPWANSEWLWTTTIAPPGDWSPGNPDSYYTSNYPNVVKIYVARVGGWPPGLATYYMNPDTGAGRIACVRP